MNKIEFINESNRIEGIHGGPALSEIHEFDRFMALESVTISDLEHFVSIYQPNAVLRTMPHLNARVGIHTAPQGGEGIVYALNEILSSMTKVGAYHTHVKYEILHPFTDCNGRSGRMLWMWQMRQAPLGFLHHFYYQSLSASRE